MKQFHYENFSVAYVKLKIKDLGISGLSRLAEQTGVKIINITAAGPNLCKHHWVSSAELKRAKRHSLHKPIRAELPANFPLERNWAKGGEHKIFQKV